MVLLSLNAELTLKSFLFFIQDFYYCYKNELEIHFLNENFSKS